MEYQIIIIFYIILLLLKKINFYFNFIQKKVIYMVNNFY